jgi:dephospho-CoA kinase
VVVDSIRDVSDLAPLEADFLRIWFVDSDEVQILKRLATRTKLGFKRPPSRPLVDSRSAMMKTVADDILDNNSSLEALRWKVDDTLFNALRFVDGAREEPKK